MTTSSIRSFARVLACCVAALHLVGCSAAASSPPEEAQVEVEDGLHVTMKPTCWLDEAGGWSCCKGSRCCYYYWEGTTQLGGCN